MGTRSSVVSMWAGKSPASKPELISFISTVPTEAGPKMIIEKKGAHSIWNKQEILEVT